MVLGFYILFFVIFSAYGLTTDGETSFTATVMLVSMIPFLILQLPKIINVDSVTQVIELITLIITLAFFVANAVYQVITLSINMTKVVDDYGLIKFHISIKMIVFIFHADLPTNDSK